MDKTGIAITYIENVIIIWYYIQMNPPDKSFPELIDGEDMGLAQRAQRPRRESSIGAKPL